MSSLVLLVDDDQSFVAMVQSLLSSEGYRTVCAENGKDAWLLAKKLNPDVILLDWQLPEINGIELTEKVRNDDTLRYTHVIMLSGRVATDDVVQAMDSGADDYLTKPFIADELLARVRAGLRMNASSRRLADEMQQKARLEMAMSVVDRLGNPLSAASLICTSLEKETEAKETPSISEGVTDLRKALNEAMTRIGSYQPGSLEGPETK